MHALTGDDASDFHRPAADLGIGEQHLPQGPAAQAGEPTASSSQGPCWNQGAGEHPRLLVAQQLDLSGPCPGIQAQPQSACFVAAGASPALAEYAHAKSARADVAQALSQRSGIEQPDGQAGGYIARE